MTKHTYWCRYEVPESIPGKHKATKWPAGMKGWVSGYTSDETIVIWCARVDAESAEEAERIVRKCYGPSADKITMSWEPQENPLGWRPGDRFPE